MLTSYIRYVGVFADCGCAAGLRSVRLERPARILCKYIQTGASKARFGELREKSSRYGARNALCVGRTTLQQMGYAICVQRMELECHQTTIEQRKEVWLCPVPIPLSGKCVTRPLHTSGKTHNRGIEVWLLPAQASRSTGRALSGRSTLLNTISLIVLRSSVKRNLLRRNRINPSPAFRCYNCRAY